MVGIAFDLLVLADPCLMLSNVHGCSWLIVARVKSGRKSDVDPSMEIAVHVL